MTGQNKDRAAALAELKKLMAEQKARLDPALLARAAEAAAKAQPPAGPSASLPPAQPQTVPYDRESAARAVELFLGDHKGGAKFRARLMEYLVKNAH